MTRSSRLAALQSLSVLARAVPTSGDCIAGTLIAAMAAANDSTATIRWDWVFWRICKPTKISDARKATAPAICASSEICSRVIPARIPKRRIHCTDEIHASAYQARSNQALQPTATLTATLPLAEPLHRRTLALARAVAELCLV